LPGFHQWQHFVGDGGTTYGTGDSEFLIDQGNTKMSEEDLRNIHLKPYQAAVKVGVYSIMPSFSSFNGQKMHANKKLMTDVLKTEMGFSGFLISDYKAIYQLRNLSYHQQVVASVNAGMDMLMEPTDWKLALNVLKDAVSKGEITKERIDDAVKRILTVKFQTGLFEKPLGDETLVKSGTGSKEHRDVAKQAVKESLVLLKNDNKILPLSKNTNVLVLGPAADNIGVQCGGWTLSWQGSTGKITEGSTILDGIKNIVSSSGGTVYTNIEDASKASVVILAIGEEPYAEGPGDEKNLDLYSGRSLVENRIDMEDAKSTGLPIVTILVSGRPRILTNELPSWNALVAAWLPGTEGDAVADVLFGNADFKGKLPMTWPKDMSQIPINKGDAGAKDALFPFGYGMSTK
jgi:beta-glucosidase